MRKYTKTAEEKTLEKQNLFMKKQAYLSKLTLELNNNPTDLFKDDFDFYTNIRDLKFKDFQVKIQFKNTTQNIFVRIILEMDGKKIITKRQFK